MYPKFKTRAKARKRSYPHLEEGFYSKKARERLVEEDALSNEEAGFMQGYEEDGFFEESLAEDFEESWH